MHHFDNVGLYDALFVMQDRESKTLWNHITGEALYGPMIGRTLGPLTNLLQMTVKQALQMDPKIQIAISDRMYFAGGKPFGTAAGFGAGRGLGPGRGAGGGRGAGPRPAPGSPNAQLSDMFIKTLGTEDTRRPRMDMGLGVWTSAVRRYYPMELLKQRGEAFIDDVDGRKVLVYVEPETSTPAAIFVTATTARIDGNDVRLDDGTVVRAGVLLDRRGKPQKTERPQQIFTRWYGFALTFPGCEVVGN
jgi:Protein of unknown function (DUF3179)